MAKSRQKIAHNIKRRLLSLALIAMLVQATLPYLLTNCPVYAGAAASVSTTHAAMPADCPMLHQAATTIDHKTSQAPAKQSPTLDCPLCAVMSPLHGFVVAGLIALPPPSEIFVSAVFVPMAAHAVRLPQTASFSARAPPVLG